MRSFLLFVLILFAVYGEYEAYVGTSPQVDNNMSKLTQRLSQLVTNLESKSDLLSLTLNDLMKQNTLLHTEVQSLKNENIKLKTDVSNIQSSQGQSSASTFATQTSFATTKTPVDSKMNNKVKILEQSVNSINQNVSTVERQVGNLELALNTTDSNLKMTQLKLVTEEQKFNSLLTNYSNLSNMYKSLSSKYDSLSSNYNSLSSQIPSTSGRCALLATVSGYRKSVSQHGTVGFDKEKHDSDNCYSNGVYTPLKTGTYMMSWLVYKYETQTFLPDVKLNGNTIAKIYASGSLTIVFKLQRGDRVWLESMVGNTMYGDDFSSFSAVLLY